MATYELPISSPLTESGDDVFCKPLDTDFSGSNWSTGTVSAIEVSNTNVYLATLDETKGYIVYLNGSSNVFTADDSTNEIIDNAHGLLAGEVVRFKGLDLPGGLVQVTLYYVIDVSTNRFRVSLTVGGSAVNLTDAGTGVMVYVATSQRSKANDIVLGTVPIVNTATLSGEAEQAAIEARRCRKWNTNKRTLQVLGANQWRYTLYDDDETTVIDQVDYDPETGEKTVV